MPATKIVGPNFRNSTHVPRSQIAIGSVEIELINWFVTPLKKTKKLHLTANRSEIRSDCGFWPWMGR